MPICGPILFVCASAVFYLNSADVVNKLRLPVLRYFSFLFRKINVNLYEGRKQYFCYSWTVLFFSQRNKKCLVFRVNNEFLFGTYNVKWVLTVPGAFSCFFFRVSFGLFISNWNGNLVSCIKQNLNYFEKIKTLLELVSKFSRHCHSSHIPYIRIL